MTVAIVTLTADDDVFNGVGVPPSEPLIIVFDVFEFAPAFDVPPITFVYFKLSQCVLYSMGVFGGKFKMRRNVSRIRFVQ